MNLFKKVILGMVCITSGMMIMSCERTLSDANQYGPTYIPAPEGFNVTGDTITPSAASVDFSVTPTLSFSATLSSTVSWTLTLTGETSGAVKTIEGVSNTVDASNASWDGGANLTFFRAGEQVDVVLAFLGTTYTVNTQITVSATKLYDGQTINGVKHLLVSDYDGGGYSMTGRPDANDGAAANFFVDGTRSVQGSNSYTLSGTDVSGNFWCGDFFTSPLNAFAGEIDNETSPNELWVNAYVYGTGKPSTTIQIALLEIDNDDSLAASIADPNNLTFDNVANAASNDVWLIKQEITHIGWKLMSFKYSQFILSPDPANGGGGNKIKEPFRVCGVRMSLNSDPLPNKEIEYGVDFLTITQGGVFQP